MEDAVFEFATRANDHLITARETFKETGGVVPKEALPVFLAGVGAIRADCLVLPEVFYYRFL
jgi:NADH dehydrogenase [ubiquinone] 1 alpha subcomplex assembly factor 6